jgi:uncharacterized membrane protein YfcA
MFYFELIAVGFLAGMIASVAGFGIGSFLIPLISIRTGAKIAIALASLPHFLGNGVRFWILKSKVNRKILIRFGLLSAIGGLGGALLHTFFVSNLLQIVFALMLVLAGVLGVLQVSERLRFGKASAAVIGLVSGFFGGLVGEQGGIRSVALLSFDVEKEAFIATATATALIVDAVRMPVYFLTQSNEVAQFLIILIFSSIAVVAGTLAGNMVLKRIPEESFKRIVSFLILLLGVFMFTIALL